MSQEPARIDPKRSVELLWATPRSPTRGPKPGLSVTQIARAAIEVADAEGLAALSMRRVADRLGVGTMSLYTYVPGKTELLDVMVDTVAAEQHVDDPATAPTPGLLGAGTRAAAGGEAGEAGVPTWRARLEQVALGSWVLYQRHPWMLQVATRRVVPGPNEMRSYDAALATVAGLGLKGREMVHVVGVVHDYVLGAAHRASEAARAEECTGMSDDDWWNTVSPVMERLLDPAAYPTLSSVDMEGAFEQAEGGESYLLQDALDAFAFGLQRVLDGVESFVARRRAGDRTQLDHPDEPTGGGTQAGHDEPTGGGA